MVHSWPGVRRFSGFERGVGGRSPSSASSMRCRNGFCEGAVVIFWALGKGLGGGESSEGRSFRSGGLGSPIFVGSMSGAVEDVAEGVKDDQEGWWLRVVSSSPILVKRSAKSAGFKSAVKVNIG